MKTSPIQFLTLLALAALALPGMVLAMPASEESPESKVTLEISDDVNLTLTGEIRTRFEYMENLVDFSNDDDANTDDEFGYVPARFRLGFNLTLPKDLEFVFDFQNITAFGNDTPDRFVESLNQLPATAWTSGAFLAGSHRDDTSVYQAYFKANNIGGSAFSVAVGRMEFEVGNELLLGVNEFYGGTSLDGIMGTFDWDKFDLHLIWARLDEQSTGGPSGTIDTGDDDTDLYGVYFVWPEIGDSDIGIDAYAMFERSGYDGGANRHWTGLESYWVGGRVYMAPEYGWHFNVEAVYNFGECRPPFCVPPVGEDNLDLGAFAAESSVGYTWDVKTTPDFHAGYSYFQGDDDVADGDFGNFIQLLPDVHKRGGFADVVTSYSNLWYWQVGYMGSSENHSWGLEFYDFSFDENGAFDESIGQEIDAYYNYQYSKNLALQFVFAYFMAGDAIEDVNDGIVDNNGNVGIDTDDGWRLYLNADLKF